MSHRFAIALIAAIVVASFGIPAHAINLISNGSFEVWSGGDTSNASQPDRVFNDGSLVVPSWNFAIGLSSDLYRDQNAGNAESNYYDAQDGDYLAGSGSFFTLHEGISQSFVALPNTMHKLTFQMAPGGLNYNGSWIENATISSHWNVQITGAVAASVNQNFASNLADFNASGTTNPINWTQKTKYFKSNAVGGLVTLQFNAYGDMTHIFLDNVVVEETAVPEPSALFGVASTAALLFEAPSPWPKTKLGCNDRRPTHFHRPQRLRPGTRSRQRRDRVVEQRNEVGLCHAAARWRPAHRLDEWLHLLPRPADRRNPLAQPAQGLRGRGADRAGLGARPNLADRHRASRRGRGGLRGQHANARRLGARLAQQARFERSIEEAAATCQSSTGRKHAPATYVRFPQLQRTRLGHHPG